MEAKRPEKSRLFLVKAILKFTRRDYIGEGGLELPRMHKIYSRELQVASEAPIAPVSPTRPKLFCPITSPDHLTPAAGGCLLIGCSPFEFKLLIFYYI
jgi:hypothetical protein